MRYLPLFALLTLFSFPTAAYSGGEFPFAPPADSALGRQLHTRIQQAQEQQKTDRLTTIQQKLAQVEKEFAPKYLSWNEFLKMNKAAQERAELSYRLDLEETKRLLQQMDGTQTISMSNSFPDYKQLLKGFRNVYVGETHYTKAAQAEMTRILKAARELYPDKRILLASEFLLRLDETKSPLKNPADTAGYFPIYPEISQLAQQLHIDQLALDDSMGVIYEEKGSYSFYEKCGRYMVNFRDKIPVKEAQKNSALFQQWQKNTGNFNYELGFSSFGVLERNRQWARYIQAVKPFYDIVLVYAGWGHISGTKSNDLQTLLGEEDVLSVILLVPEEGSLDLSPQQEKELMEPLKNIPSSQQEKQIQEEAAKMAEGKVALTGEWEDPTKPFWGMEVSPNFPTVPNAPVTKKTDLFLLLPTQKAEKAPAAKPAPSITQPEPLPRKGNLFF